MKKLIVVGLVLISFFVVQVGHGQGLTSKDIYTSVKYHMKSDNLVFPDDEIYQLVNLGAEMACVFGFAYPKVDTLTLSTGTEEYGLTKLALWVYRIGKIGEGDRSWQSMLLADFGKYQIKEVSSPNYYDFVTVVESVDSAFSAGNDTSYVYVYPKPTSADNNDSILVHYFALDDTINSNLKNVSQDLVLELTLMCGYIRDGRTDKAVDAWNHAGTQMTLLTNYWLQRIYNIEVVPKNVGGR